MNKKIITIIFGIFLIASVSSLLAGECESFDMNEFENVNNISYTVVGNQSNLDGLEIGFNETQLTICPSLNYKPDDFTLIFFDNDDKIKEVIVYKSSGRKTKTVYENITEYIEVDKIEYIENIGKENVTEYIEVKVIEEKINIFQRFWNLLKGLFD